MTNEQSYAGLLERLLESCIDWTGEPIVDGSTPRYELSCGDIREAAEAISSLLKRVGELEGLLREADEIAWPEAAILALHRDPARQTLAKATLYEWRDRVRAALNSDAPLSIGEEQ